MLGVGNTCQRLQGLVILTDHYLPAGRLGNGEHHDAEQDAGHDFGADHPAPAVVDQPLRCYITGNQVIHGKDDHLAGDDGNRLHAQGAPPHAFGRDLGHIHGRDRSRQTHGQPANHAVDDKPDEAVDHRSPYRRHGKQHSGQNERFLATQTTGYPACTQGTDDAADDHIRNCPAGLGRRQGKIRTQRVHGAGNDGSVISEQNAA